MYLGNQKVTPVIVQGGGESPLNLFTIEDGYLRQNSTVLDGTGIKYIDSNSFSVLSNFYQLDTSKITELNFPDLESIDLEDGYDFRFSGMKYLTKAYFPKLKRAKFEYMFNGTTSLQSFNLDSLEDIGGHGKTGLNSTFYGSGIKEAVFPNLTTIRENGLNGTFAGSSISLCRFPKLEMLYTVKDNDDYEPFFYCFYECNSVDIYFNALKTTSFEDRFVLSQMLEDANGCVLHFPSNLQSVVEGLFDYPDFGGSNTTILFDLEPTE